MKTCVSSYSFNKLLKSGVYTQLTLIKEVKNMGFDAIEFTDLEPTDGVSVIDFAHLLREESDKQKLPIANYTIGAELLNCPNLDDEVARLFKQVDIASILGVKGMRHDATGGYKDIEKTYKSFDQALRVLVEGCRRVTEYAGEKGIATMVENHGFSAKRVSGAKSWLQALVKKTLVCCLIWATSFALMKHRSLHSAD